MHIDKLYHFLVGLVITLLGLYLHIDKRDILIIVCSIALLKEAYDFRHPDKHVCDIWDFIYTVLPLIILLQGDFTSGK